MSEKTITGLLVDSSELDCWISDYLKGRPVVIAGNSYRIDELILRHREGLVDLTLLDDNEESEGEGYLDMNQPFLSKEKVASSTNDVDPLLQVDRSLLNRKGKREADKVLAYEQSKHVETGLNFEEALNAAYSGKAIRRKGWLDKYWTLENDEYYDQMMVFETFINQGLRYKKRIDVNHSYDAYATDWEAIDID